MQEYAFDTDKLIDVCRSNAVVSVGVFGSMARGQSTPQSDIDLLVEFKDRKSLLDLVRLERELSISLGRKVDLLTKDAISPYLRNAYWAKFRRSMKRDELVYLRHVLDAIGRIEQYTLGVDEQTFHEKSLIQDGVIRQLEIIGEAVKSLPISIREKYPQIPWQDIAGTRDKLIHHYFGVSLDEVWLMVQRDIPVFKAEVVGILGKSS